MKIAHLWYTVPIFGGAETWALGLSKALRSLGIVSEIVCWGAEKPQGNSSLFRVLGEHISSPPDIVDALMNGAYMASQLEDYDLICPHHSNVLFPSVFSKSLYGNQIACILHSPPLGWQLSGEGRVSYRDVSEKNKQTQTVWKMFIHHSDFFFTNSMWNQKLYEQHEGILPTPLIGGVDQDVYKPDKRLRTEFREKLDLDDETILLFYSSAAGHRKRHEILLRGMRELTRRYKVKCVLTCSKDHSSRSVHPLVGRIITNLRLEKDVFTFPAASDKTLLGLYNASDIYVHPANNEHLGMAIMEAMAVGKPVVAQANGGVPEIVEDGSEGFLFKTDSSDHMVKCIEKLIDNEELREATGRRARERAKGFDWSKVAQRFLQVITA